MENTGVLDTADYSGSTEEIRLTNESLGYLKETAKWATFFAILGFITMGLMVLGGIGAAFFLSSSAIPGMEGMAGMAGIGFVYVIFAAIYFYPTYKLYQFASKCKRSLATSSTDLMTEALGCLKSCYKFFGILMIILLGFYAIMFIFGGAAAMFMG